MSDATAPSHGSAGADQFRLLRLERFGPLFYTQFLGAFNDNVYKNALIIAITFRAAAEDNANSAFLVTLSAGIFILPFFLFSATAGQIADKYEKAMLIRRVKIGEIGIMVLGAVGFATGNVPFLMAVLFLMGTQSALFGPLKYGILPQHLEERELTGGNGLIQMATYIAILGGTIVGGLLVAMKPGGPLVVSAVVIVLAVLGWITSRGIPLAAPSDPAIRMSLNLPRATVRCIGYARENVSVFAAVVGISWFWFVGATFLQLLPTYGRDVLGGNAQVVTLLLAAFSVGIGIGSLSCERFSAGHIELGLVPIGALGLSVFACVPWLLEATIAAAPPAPGSLGVTGVLANAYAWPLLAGFLALAVSGGLYIVPLYALVQSRSNPAHRARIIAANNILNALFMVVSAVLTITLLKASFALSQIFVGVAVLNVGVAAYVFTAVPEFRERFAAMTRSS